MNPIYYAFHIKTTKQNVNLEKKRSVYFCTQTKRNLYDIKDTSYTWCPT